MKLKLHQAEKMRMAAAILPGVASGANINMPNPKTAPAKLKAAKLSRVKIKRNPLFDRYANRTLY
jgi:hypothetical protein